MFAENEHECHRGQGALSNKRHVKGGPSLAQPDSNSIDVTLGHAIATVKLATAFLSTASSTAILLYDTSTSWQRVYNNTNLSHSNSS